MTDSPPAHVQFANAFKVELRTLAKRYRQIRADMQPLIEQLQVGELPGDQISGTGYTVFKVRVKNSDVRKGKSAGYRIIYQSLSPTSVLLLLIYAKSDRTDVSTKEIQEVIKKFQSDPAP